MNLTYTRSFLNGALNTISFQTDKHLLFGNKCYTMGSAFAIAGGLYLVKKTASVVWNRFFKKAPFPLENLAQQKDIFGVLVDKLPADVALNLNRTCKTMHSALGKDYFQYRYYKKVFADIIQGLRSDVSLDNVGRIADSLAKFDPEKAVEILSALQPFKPSTKREFDQKVSLILRTFLYCKDMKKNSAIFKHVFSLSQKKIDTVLKKESIIQMDSGLVLTLLSYLGLGSVIISKTNSDLSNEISNYVEKTLKKIETPKHSKFLTRSIFALEEKNLKKILGNLNYFPIRLDLIKAFVKSEYLNIHAKNSPGTFGNNKRALIFYSFSLIYTNPEKALENFNTNIQNDKFFPLSEKVNFLLKLHKQLHRKESKQSKRVLDKAKALAESKPGDVNEILVAERYASLNCKKEAKQLFDLAERMIQKKEKKQKYLELTLLATKMSPFDPEKSRKLFEEALKGFAENKISLTDRFYFLCIDRTPPMFWSIESYNHVCKLPSKDKLLFLLRIFENCPFPVLKESFLKQLEQIEIKIQEKPKKQVGA